MEDRLVEIDGTTFKIRIGYGTYHRIDYLRLIVDATKRQPGPKVVEDEEPDVDEPEEKISAEDAEVGVQAALAALKAEGILTKEEEELFSNQTPDIVGADVLLDMLELEGKLADKVRDAKLKIIKLSVRKMDGTPIDDELLENGLSPAGGERLFTQVMETFEVLKSGVEDVETKKK